MNIGYIGGFWATNIGNSFYNIGMLELLKIAGSQNNIYFIPDPPQVNWSRINGDYSIISKLNIDLYIISGPIFGTNLEKIYSNIFEEIKKRGGKLAFISAGAVEYSEAEADSVASFLSTHHVEFVFTRDSQTFELYKDRLNTNVYDGLCTSMFLNDAVNPPDINDEYIVTNFPFWHEPVIERVENKWIVKKGLSLSRQDKIIDIPIVRLQSKGIIPNLRFINTGRFLFNRTNMYYSDLPYGYLAILKSAKIIFSDRVHTCAAGLILGNSCMYIKGQRRSRDGRNNLFLRLGLQDIYEKPVSLDMTYIESEKTIMINQLSRLLCNIK